MTESPLSPDQRERVVAIAMDLARQGRTAELLEFLDHGLPVDAADADGNTLLMLAAYHGHAETVGALVERGADVDLRNSRDQSAVAGALFKGEAEVVRTLVAAGADLDAGTPTARAAAAMFGQLHLLREGEA
jgi:ankyrin repeat protein